MLDFNDKKTNFFAGLACLFIVICLWFGFSKFGMEHNNSVTYLVKAESSIGLKKHDKVYMSGYPIGYIEDINLIGDDLYLKLSIDKKIMVSVDSFFKIAQQSLLTSRKNIILVAGYQDIAPENYEFSSEEGLNLDDLVGLVGAYMAN